MKLYRYAEDKHGIVSYEPPTPEDIIAAFSDLPLPQRMRVAAKVADEVVKEKPTRKYGGHWPAGTNFVTGDLLNMADHWELEDAEKSKESAEIEELLGLLREEQGATCEELATILHDAGYRKRADDE